MSIFGVMLRNNSGNTSVLLLLIIMISGLLVLSTFPKMFNAIFTNLLPLIIVAIAITLLCHIPLISPYLIGFDVHLEKTS